MLLDMSDKSKIKLIGNSAAVFLDKGSLKVYGLKTGDDVDIEYKYPRIIIKKREIDHDIEQTTTQQDTN